MLLKFTYEYKSNILDDVTFHVSDILISNYLGLYSPHIQ